MISLPIAQILLKKIREAETIIMQENMFITEFEQNRSSSKHYLGSQKQLGSCKSIEPCASKNDLQRESMNAHAIDELKEVSLLSIKQSYDIPNKTNENAETEIKDQNMKVNRDNQTKELVKSEKCVEKIEQDNKNNSLHKDDDEALVIKPLGIREIGRAHV